MEDFDSLHSIHVQTKAIVVNRLHTALHSLALIILFYYRLSYFFHETETRKTPNFIWLLVFLAELLLSFIWFLNQAFRWRPISRTTFPERLPEDDKLPSIDVFICTADPEKEPTFEVMNTVVSAMALDYPLTKLNVYLSDDGGSHLTLHGMKEAWKFSRWWLPFCRTYEIGTRSPLAFFSNFMEDDNLTSEFMDDTKKIKEKYEMFKENIVGARGKDKLGDKIIDNRRDHPAVVELIHDEYIQSLEALHQADMPRLVYVSREKRPSHPHHFKAGALNVLLRVSGIISNSPYILVLDCDMYCNDSKSARQAICFHLDSNISPNLGFVQFPQKFHNISKHDIYDSELKSYWKVLWPGQDGLQGPILSGTGFYLKRDALYRAPFSNKDIDIKEIRQSFGTNSELIKSVLYKTNVLRNLDSTISSLHHECRLLASCTCEDQTKWGQEVGFMYASVVEDFLTGFKVVHCKGWKSVYYDPPIPQFLGSGVTNLNDLLVQSTRWSTGLIDVAFSRFLPLIYGPGKVSLLQSMCYAEVALFPLYFISLWCFGIIPQLCLLKNIPLYPEVSNSFFAVFLFVFLSSHLKSLQEVLTMGGSSQSWVYIQRIWMIMSTTCYLYGTVESVMKKTGAREASFLPTDKAGDDEKEKLYQSGKFDFRTSNMFLVPLVSIVILNAVSFIVGVARMITIGNWEKMFAQCLLSFFVLVMSYPVIEGMVLRTDKGRIRPHVTMLSCVFTLIFFLLGSILLA